MRKKGFFAVNEVAARSNMILDESGAITHYTILDTSLCLAIACFQCFDRCLMFNTYLRQGKAGTASYEQPAIGRGNTGKHPFF